MNCPHCKRNILESNSINGRDLHCHDDNHSFYYNKGTMSFYLKLFNKEIEIGHDYIGYYIIINNLILDISSFEIEDCNTIAERYMKLLVFS